MIGQSEVDATSLELPTVLVTNQHSLSDAEDFTEGYRTWWSYVPHFIGTPGYVYAYAYGQLLALSVYARYEAEGDAFVPSRDVSPSSSR